jgi:hypothetical protein
MAMRSVGVTGVVYYLSKTEVYTELAGIDTMAVLPGIGRRQVCMEPMDSTKCKTPH